MVLMQSWSSGEVVWRSSGVMFWIRWVRIESCEGQLSWSARLAISFIGRPAIRCTFASEKKTGPPNAAAPTKMRAAFSAINMAESTAWRVGPPA
jgi:hypothetical protein